MRFRYLKDPLFVFCLVVYFANRWLCKPYTQNQFSISYLNDLICIPFWVPIMLFIMRRIGLRTHDRCPSASEILVPLLLWSVVFEIALPFWERLKAWRLPITWTFYCTPWALFSQQLFGETITSGATAIPKSCGLASRFI